MRNLYYTTMSCAKVESPFWYYNAEKYGNLIYCNGTDLRDYIENSRPSNEFEEKLLITNDNNCIVTNKGLKLALNV